MPDSNPIRLRTTSGILTHAQTDENLLAMMRLYGLWEAGSYQRNRVVWHEGFFYVSDTNTSTVPDDAVSDWIPLTGLNGCGSMQMAATAVPGADLGAGWQTLDQFDTIVVSGLGCTLDPSTGEFSFLYRGVWDIAFYLSFDHNSSNQGRNTNIRLYNVTTGTPGVGTVLPTGRNAEASTFSSPLMLNINAEVDQVWRVEIGGGDTYTSVEYDALILNLHQIGIARP